MKSLLTEKPLTEAELDRLESFLAALKEKDDLAMDLEEVDGFFAALIASPEMVMPSEYMVEIIWWTAAERR